MTVTPSLGRWIADLDAQSYADAFPGSRIGRQVAPVRERFADYYLSLVAELFDQLRNQEESSSADWAVLGNALADIDARESHDLVRGVGIAMQDALLFSATAFTFGGFPASAYMVARGLVNDETLPELERASIEMLTRPVDVQTAFVGRLVAAIRAGDLGAIDALQQESAAAAVLALDLGPSAWIPATLLDRLVSRLRERNVRAVLPDGSDPSWNPLVESMLSRRPPIWEFFPSQVDAIEGGLLSSAETFSLQMPTGAGKTALTETLLYRHATSRPGEVAVLIVPLRSLASELRWSMVQRLNDVGVRARSAYGGSVSTAQEAHDVEDLSVLVATPETLSGLIGVNDDFYRRISLVICDEGHLLDNGNRGVALELLLARLLSRESGRPRFVFVSAIVPNIEEVNSWLGGTDDTVIQSDYRPALAEFAVIHDSGRTPASYDLVMHPEMEAPTRFSVHGFLQKADFEYINEETGRLRTYDWTSIKSKAVAAARKAMVFGPVAIFAAAKSGHQGAIGVADELLKQLAVPMGLPRPLEFAATTELQEAEEFLSLEFGGEWIGTKALQVGCVLHHGDIPQETREVLEHLVRASAVGLVICTTTLAEGVNLPIRSLVLYTIQRRTPQGVADPLLARDIKNLVGRAGRPHVTTRGLVVCANEGDWGVVRQVARGQGSEPVRGALGRLVGSLRRALARQAIDLDNATLEESPDLWPLVDGVDAALIDLAAEEVGEDELLRLASSVAAQTFAYEQLDPPSSELLETVFALRARRVIEARNQGRVAWVRATGARLRLADTVADDLIGRRPTWDDIEEPLDPSFVRAVVAWAWDQRDLRRAIRDAYRLPPDVQLRTVRREFRLHVEAWLAGDRVVAIAARLGRSVDETIRIQTSVVSYGLQTLTEQGIALLDVALRHQGSELAPAAKTFPQHLRFGVPTTLGRRLAELGVRHRSASVELGRVLTDEGISADTPDAGAGRGLATVEDDLAGWTNRLGRTVVENTRADLVSIIGRN